MSNQEVRMRLSEETMDKVKECNYLLGCSTLADTVARSVRVALLLANAVRDGAIILVKYPNGNTRELIIK